MGINLRQRNRLARTGKKRVEEKNMKEAIKHENFTKYAGKMTKSHLIASIREAGKVNILVKGNCHNFLGVLIDGMGK